jgi:hypothetical protein
MDLVPLPVERIGLSPLAPKTADCVGRSLAIVVEMFEWPGNRRANSIHFSMPNRRTSTWGSCESPELAVGFPEE